MNRSACPVAVVLCALVSAQSAHAKAYYAPKKEMIHNSVAIAVVDIGKVQTADDKGEHWTYGQRATAKVTEVLKGELPKEITLHGGESFICAQCDLAEGKHVVFLRKDGDKWVGSNWHLSIRPIKDDKVEWYVDDKSTRLAQATLKDVLEEVRAIVKAEPGL